MKHRHASVAVLAVIAAVTLSGCVSFGIYSPANRTIYAAPTTVPIVIKANPSMTGLAVTDNAAAFTNTLTSITSTEATGSRALTEGSHRFIASADVPCWYCSPHMTHTVEVCVQVASWPAFPPTMTSSIRSNGQAWAKTSDTTVGVAPDSGALATRWQLLRTTGIQQSAGQIRSIENTCLCMKSMADQGGTPIGLAFCDASDPTQIWEALPIPSTGGHYRFQNAGRSTSSACLTRDASNVLVQASCLDTDDQVWRIKDNSTGSFVSPF
jgi:hypothetical protein